MTVDDRNFVAEAERVQKHKRRLIALFIALLFAFLVGAICSTIIYNSADGIARTFGQFIGAAIIPALIGLFARRATYTPAAVVAATTLLVAVQNAPQLIESIDARKGIAALSEVRDPTQIDQALKKDPSNTFLQLITGAMRLAQETQAAALKLSEESEPSALANINLTSATRADLEAILRNLKIAQANAEAAMPRYTALLKKSAAMWNTYRDH